MLLNTKQLKCLAVIKGLTYILSQSLPWNKHKNAPISECIALSEIKPSYYLAYFYAITVVLKKSQKEWLISFWPNRNNLYLSILTHCKKYVTYLFYIKRTQLLICVMILPRRYIAIDSYNQFSKEEENLTSIQILVLYFHFSRKNRHFFSSGIFYLSVLICVRHLQVVLI